MDILPRPFAAVFAGTSGLLPTCSYLRAAPTACVLSALAGRFPPVKCRYRGQAGSRLRFGLQAPEARGLDRGYTGGKGNGLEEVEPVAAQREGGTKTVLDSA